MSKELSKSYEPNWVEEKIYEFWQNEGCFTAKIEKNKKPYTIVMPPPNITGHLHMGHALDETLQDILIRFKRMQGYSTLWIPGTDHASIATEAKIVEAMRKEGIKKTDIGREEFLKRAYEWKEKYGGKIIEQVKKLGASCDWTRERFTMDEGNKSAVNEVFVRLYEKGLIYRGERIINWCPKCKTSISDAEVNFSEHDGNFYHLKYELSDGSGFVEVATTRPETILGDTAIAVNPDDSRYKHLIGKNAVVGNSTEIKNSILFDGVQAPHYNYIGDSILGYKSHMGAGSITSNVKSDKSIVKVAYNGEKIDTGLKKFGAVIGDYTEIGCNTVLNPGTIIGRNSNIYPLSSVRGFVPENSIYKSASEIIKKN